MTPIELSFRAAGKRAVASTGCTKTSAALGALLGWHVAANAADATRDYPLRPIRLVSPFAAGGSTDTIGRLLAPRLSQRLGQNVIIENRPGAGGMIGTASVAKA
ncbi:MAG TPA: tripartite tricarboxylate transporter substrate-binding protein, partial [Burkholderiales bacterium]|nr:tripartite tricarboxylate transporter substrate-binding protein [Burkholderiales bacterium]